MLKQTVLKLETIKHSLKALAWAVLFGVLVFSSVQLFNRGSQVQAATSGTLNFQARLLNASGSVVPDGFYNIEFKLYDATSGGTALWTETYYDSNGGTAGNDNRLRVKNGYFSVNLGSLDSLADESINWDQDLWITMNVGGSIQTATPIYDGEMSPRIKLTSVPFALQAGGLAKRTDASNLTVVSFAAPSGVNTITLPAASGTVCLTSGNCIGSGGSGDILQGGNSFSTAITIGTNDAHNLLLETDGTTRLTIDTSGNATLTGNFVAQGGSLTVGTASQGGTIILNDGSTHTGSLTVAALGQDVTYTLPDPGGANDTICLLTLGNCVGGGTGGAIGGSGTTNYLAKFTAAGTIGNSLLFDNGTGVGISDTNPSDLLTIRNGLIRAGQVQGGNNSTSLLFLSPGSASDTESGIVMRAPASTSWGDLGSNGYSQGQFITLLNTAGGNIDDNDTHTATVTNVANTTPVRLTTATHSFQTGDIVRLTGTGISALDNHWWKITVINSTTVDLDDTTASGTSSTGYLYGNQSPVLARFDARGGFGLTGGIHVGYGVRGSAGQSFTPGASAAVWIDSSYDAVGLVIDNATTTEWSATPVSDFLTIRDNRGTPLSVVIVDSTGKFIANRNALIKSSTNTTTALQVVNASDSPIFNVDTTNGQVGINTATPSADLTFGEGANRTVNVETRSTNAVGNNLSITAGAAGSGGTARAGGALSLQGGAGAGTTGSAAGGNVNIVGGNAAGSNSLIGGSIQIYGGAGVNGSGYGNIFLGGGFGADIGLVGVGGAAPAAKLHVQTTGTPVNGTAVDLFKITDLTATAVDVVTIADGGAATFRNQTNSTTAFRVQNSAGTSILNVDATNQRVGIGTGASVSAKLQVNAAASGVGLIVMANATTPGDLIQFQNSSSSVLSGFNASGNLFFNNSGFAGTLQTASLTGNRTYTLPNESGTLCTTTSGCTGSGGATAFVQGGNAFGTTATLGTTENQPLSIVTNSVERINVAGTGVVTVTGGIVGNSSLRVSTTSGFGSTGTVVISKIVNAAHTVDLSGAVGCIAGCVGVDSSLTLSGTAGFTGAAFGVRGKVTTAASSSGLLQAVALYADTNVKGTSSLITDSYGLYVATQNAGTNNYGVYIQGAGTYGLWVDSGLSRFDGNVQLNNGTNSGTFQLASLTGNQTYTLPDASGTLCIQGSASCGFAAGSGLAILQDGNSFGVNVVIGSNDFQELRLETNGSTRIRIANDGKIRFGNNASPDAMFHFSSGANGPDILRITDSTNSTNVLAIVDGGATTFRNDIDSTTAFQVQNNAGTAILNVDATNRRVGIGTITPRVALDVTTVQDSSIYLTSTSIALGAGDSIGTIGFYSNDSSTNAAGNKAFIRAVCGDAPCQAVDLLFATSNSTSATGTEKWRITNNGVLQASGSQTIQSDTDSLTITSGGANANINITPTGTGVLKIATTDVPTLSGAKLIVTHAEVTTILRIGDGTNNVQLGDFASTGRLFNGTFRPIRKITLVPEFQGATLAGVGGSNSGTVTTDFCSENLSVNTGVCVTDGDEHNYYSWTTTQGTPQTYDIYVRHRLPSDFDEFASTSTLKAYAWRTGTGEKAEVTVFRNGSGTACGSTVDAADFNANNTEWKHATLTDVTGCSFAAGDVMTFRIRLTATNGNYARIGAIEFDYLAKF